MAIAKKKPAKAKPARAKTAAKRKIPAKRKTRKTTGM